MMEKLCRTAVRAIVTSSYSINAGASNEPTVYAGSNIVPASRSSLAFPLLEGRGKLSTGVEISDSPSVSLSIFNEVL
jgi:hypothetical protein